MASGGAEEDDGGIPLDIDNVHMLLQVEHEQIQKRTFTNWINSQLAKRCSPTFVSDLFSDLRDGSQLLDLLEVMSGQPMKRQRGRGFFQHRANIETALNFLRKKSVKLVNINVSDIIDGRPSIILGLIWTIILHCHIEELASTLSYSSCHSSLDSLSSLDSWSSSPVPASPVPAGRTSPLHRRFRVSAKKALLMWVRDQCQKVGCSIRVRDFKSSWRSGEAFLAILCSLRPQLVDLSLVQSRGNQENLEEAFHLAERELHIPRLLEPQDVDVNDPEEKSILTYVAQFLQYSNDMPAPDDHLQLFPSDQSSPLSPVNLPAPFTPASAVSALRQASPSERALQVTRWLQQTHQELSEARAAMEMSSFLEKYQVFQNLFISIAEQRRPVMTLLAAARRCPDLTQDQCGLRTAWDCLEEELQRCKADLDSSLPPPLDSLVVWLKRAEAAVTEEVGGGGGGGGGRGGKGHAEAAKEARAQQETVKDVTKEMSHHVKIFDTYRNMDDSGNLLVPLETFDDIKRRLTNIRVTAKYKGIQLEYEESCHTVLDLLGRISAKVQSWKGPYRSEETVHMLLQDWHETVERQGLLLILMDALQNLKEKVDAYSSKAALAEASQRAARQVKEAEGDAELVTQAVAAARGTMERTVSAWETYNNCISSLQTWLAQRIHSHAQPPAAGTQDMSQWTSCQAKLNEAGNMLIEVTEPSASLALAEQLSKVNMQWAECMKRTVFEVSSVTAVSPLCLQMVHSLTQDASRLLGQPVEVSSVPLKAIRQKIQLLCKKMASVDLSSLSSSTEKSPVEKLLQTLPQMLAEAERACGELQRAASTVEGRLAELDHWSTEALDCHQLLKEKKHRGAALESTAKALVSRGLQLESQVVAEGQDLQGLVARVQNTSPLQHLSTSGMQDRISEAVSQCQEILGLFSSIGFLQPVETAIQKQPEEGLYVVARTKHVDQVGKVMLQSQDPNQVSPGSPSQTPQQRPKCLQSWPKQQLLNTQEEITIRALNVQMLPPPLMEPEPQIHCVSPQSVKETSPALNLQSFPKSHTLSPSQSDRLEPALTQATPPTEKQSSLPSQTPTAKPRIRGQPDAQMQSNKASPRLPIMIRREVHSKAQSMARSRLEKARFRLQGRIQQAIKLFGGKDISESQAKRKQRALKILQPAILEEFLGAVEGLGAFCTGPQLQDLMLLSDSVREQWEDVRREMAAFVPVLWSKIREGQRSFSVLQCESQTNPRHEATDPTDHDSLLQQQVIMDEAASVQESAESLQELCETLTPRKSSCLATDQLRESDETQEAEPCDAMPPSDRRGRQLRGNAPQRATGVASETQRSSNNLAAEQQSVDSQPQHLSPEGRAESAQPPGDVLPRRARDVPADGGDDLTQGGGSGSRAGLKPALRPREQTLRARVLHVAQGNQQSQTHVQAVVRGNTVETKQEAERTVIAEAAVPPQEEQEVLKRYRESCLAFQSELQKNQQHLEECISDPVTTSTLQSQKKQLQTLKLETESLWFEFELQWAQLSQFSHQRTGEDKDEVEREREQLTQQWRGQQMCLLSRMTSLENTESLMESADDRTEQITEKLDRILRPSVDISSFTLADPQLVSDLKEMDDEVQSEMRKLSERAAEEERRGPGATSSSPFCLALHSRVHHLQRLRQRLDKVQSASRALHHFLATAREVEAQIPTLLSSQDPDRQQTEADGEQERQAWQAAAQQKLQTAAEQSDSVDSALKAAGMTLTMDGAAATCQDVVTSLCQRAEDLGGQLMRARKRELFPEGTDQTETGEDSPLEEKEHPAPSVTKEESGLEAKRSRLEGDNEAKPQSEEERKGQTWKSERDVGKAKDQRRRRSSQIKKDEEERENLIQRREALSGSLREIRGAAEQLGLQEPTLPALQQRMRTLTELECRLAGHLAGLQQVREAPSGSGGVSQNTEVEDIYEEAKKAVTERLEQCRVLTELLKRFQSIRGELSGTLQRAESTISEQASYMGKDNLLRLHAKVQETKAELNGLSDGIKEVRSVCRQLQSHLRQIPECTTIPFEDEADSLMDRWLDITERTDSQIENLHRAVTLWDGVLQLGAEVENWTSSKMAEFAQSPSFQTEEDMVALQSEFVAQEENMERFQRRVSEVQVLLQSTEPPLELQVVETQIRKKLEQLREVVSEAEDVYRQMVATKGQISTRMAECLDCLQKIQDSLLTLSGSDVSTVLAKLKELLFELQTQDEQAEGLLEDLHVMASIASSASLQSVCAVGAQLQDKVRHTHRLFSEVEEQTESNIQALDRLQRESERLEQWLQAAEQKAAKEEDLSVLQEEALLQRVRTDALSQLVSSLQSSTLQQCTPVEDSSRLLERYDTVLRGLTEQQGSPARRDGGGVQTGSEAARSSAVEGATTEGEGHHTEFRVSGSSLSQGQCDGHDLNVDLQETVQDTEESVQPRHSVDLELASSCLAPGQQACRSVEDLWRRAAQLPASFPWPGIAERRRTRLLACQLQNETEALHMTVSSLAEQREDATRKDSTSDELETRWSSLMAELKDVCARLEEGACNEEHFGQLLQHCHHKLTSLQERMSACQAQKDGSVGVITAVAALEALLQDVTDVEKDLLQITALQESISASLTAEAQASLSQEVCSLQDHKRELDSNIRESLALLSQNSKQRVQPVEEEVSCVHTALKGLAESLGDLCESCKVLPDISQLKQQWHTIQDGDSRLTELAARVDLLQTRGSSVTQETLPADGNLTVDAVAKDLDSLRSVFLQMRQKCAENTANKAGQIISQLHTWSQTAQAEPSSLSQAHLDEGLCLERAVGEVLSERDFLRKCLGKKKAKKLEKRASDALRESAPALETLRKHLVPHADEGHCEAESYKETFTSETDAPHSVSTDATMATCPPASPSPSAADSKESCKPDQNDGKTKLIAALETAKKHTRVPCEVPSTEVTEVFISRQQEAQLTQTPPKINSKAKDGTGTLNTDREQESSQLTTRPGNNTHPLMSDSRPTPNNRVTARQESSIQDVRLSATGRGDLVEISSVTSLAGSSGTNPDSSPLPTPENVFERPAAQPETYEAAAQERHEGISVTPKKVFTIVLNMEPQDMRKCEDVSPDVDRCSQGTEVYGALSETARPVTNAQETEKSCEGVRAHKVFTVVLDLPESLPQDTQHRASVPDVLRCSQEAELSNAQPPGTRSSDTYELTGSLISRESNETDLKSYNLTSALSMSQVAEQPSAEEEEEEEETSTRARLSYSEGRELLHNEVINPSESHGTVTRRQLSRAHAAETTFAHVRQDEVTDVCRAEEQTTSSAVSGVERGASAGTQIPAGEEQLTAADSTQSAGAGQPETAERDDTEETGDPESKRSNVPQRRAGAQLPTQGRGVMVAASLEDTGMTQGKIQESMEPERTPPGLAADRPAGETTGGSAESCKHKFTMQDILSEVQGLVERSNIINRSPHIDLNWYLRSSPGEPEIRLVRTVQKVLACRYQPAQLNVTAMATQLQEAEDYRCCVQAQVATMKSTSATKRCNPGALKRLEGQWSAALLDASATVQVKAAQLNQVQQYHKQMKILRAFLEVLAVEKDKMNLNSLGSSALQADKLHALLQTMALKKDMMEGLLQVSGQLSVHLSDAESSGALLAQLGDVQEEWRLVEGSIKRALQHASSSTSQSSLLIKEAEQLKYKLEAIQKSSFQSDDSQSALELVCLTTDLKLYNQLYLLLQSQADSLVHFFLGQKEKDELRRSLQELGSSLNDTKSKLDTSTYSCGTVSSAKISKQLQDLIIWAKQAENHISIGKKLALFPEEARIQIVEMKKFQTDIWSRRSKMQMEVEQMKDEASDREKEESDQVLKTIEDLYEAIAASLDHVLDTMKKDLREREKLLGQLASMDAWLADTHAKREPRVHIDNVSKADVRKLESELKSHKSASVEIESQLSLVEAMADRHREIAVGLSPGESRYLVNRLSGLWTELDGLLAHEKAISWELEELIHERTSSDKELSTIQASLQQISANLEQQKFPSTQETLSTVAQLNHRLMEHQCEVQELQHCQESKRSPLLYAIGELQDRCKALTISAFEQDKYLHLRRQMEESRDIAKEQIEHAKDKEVSMGDRFRLCQTLLVELPLVKTQCQEAADQLEAVAQDLHPTELESERQRIRRSVETLVSWEHAVTDDIKNLENKLLLGLRFSSELPALMEVFQRTRSELQEAEPVNPDEKAVDIALQRHWVIWRNMESGMRVLEGLARKEKVNLKNHKDLYSLWDAAKQECHSQMENLCHARESLKDYQWAAQGAISFLHNAEATFLSAPGGFLDCTEEQRQTQQALHALEDGFQAHISHLAELLPQQPCLSRPKTEQLHISILSQLLVGRATLEAQAQLRLESLQRCEMRQQSHRKWHEDIRQCFLTLEARLSKCAAEQVTSFDKCAAQQKRAELLMRDLRSLTGKIEELRAGCPMQGCGVGKDGELGALWRRWVSLRRGVGLLMAHTQQRGEEWRDITTSMEQCCSSLTCLQADVPDSTVSFTHEEPQELLAQAEMCQAGLEQEQQALASLEHRLEHALSLSTSQDPASPGPVGKTLLKIQENVRSLKERNLLVVAAAQAEERERQHVQEQIGEVEQDMFTILRSLGGCSNPHKQQELRKDLSSQKAKLKRIMDGVQSRYAEIPADISRRLQEVQLDLQREEQKLTVRSGAVQKLDGQVRQLEAGLEKVTVLLEQKSPTVNDAQNVLKHVWDELDSWHSRLMILENEVQDLAEEHPDQAHLLMDRLTQPLQLYQNTAQLAEQRTAFLSKIPACLQDFEDIVYSATCWLDEAQSWLSAPCSFTTARSLQNHASSLQLVLDDSERIRHALQDFSPVLNEISAVCDVSTHKTKLEQNDRQVQKMQLKVLEPLDQLLQAAPVVEAIEEELRTMEKNVPKIRAILSSMDNPNITAREHLNNRQVILANVQSMQRTLEEMERCKGELQLPQGAEESLLVVSRGRLLLQPLEELEQLTQQQSVLLENRIREENPDITDSAEEMQRLERRRIQKQEAFEVSNSEEEEDEENESCHSSSSDTLTCSIPEDPDETLSSSYVQSEETVAQPEIKAPGSLAHYSSPEVTVSTSVKPGLDLKEPGSEKTERDSVAMDPKADVGPEAVTASSPVAASGEGSEGGHGSPKHDTTDSDLRTKSPQAAAAVEDTRLIPLRPRTPFTATRASHELIEEEDRDLFLSTDPPEDLDVSRGQCEVDTGLVEESQQAQESSKEPISSAGHEGDNEGRLRWSRLHEQISQKLTTLKKVKEEHQTLISSEDGGVCEKAADKELMLSGSASAALRRTHESIAMLSQTVSSAAGVSEELYAALRGVLLCLDAVTDLLLMPAGGGDDDPRLRLLQHECVSTELLTLAELLSKVQCDTRPALLEEEPAALSCLSSLQDCLHTVHPILTSSHRQITEQQELCPSRLCILDEFEQSEIFPGIKEAPGLERCVLGRHLRESPGEKARLQQASRSLLQGITRLLELGEGCMTGGRTSRVQSRGRLQAALCGRKELLQVLRSQLAFVQHLFTREPEALRCQEDERVQLEVRAKALQQRALEQDVASQRRIQEWIQWEESCGQLGRLLDDAETLSSSGKPDQQDAYQQTLVQLDGSRAALGLLLDQEKALQTEDGSAAAVSRAAAALELRWRSAYRRAETEIQRCRDVQESRARFQSDFDSVSEWLTGARKHLKAWSNMADTSDLKQESVHNHLIKLLDFSMETEVMSVQRTSTSREATHLYHLREADCPGLRAQLGQLEVSWSRLTSDLSKIQEGLQQRLLASWPPVKLLSDLEVWLKKLEARLSQEKETAVKAEDAAQITKILQRYQELKAGLVNGQLLLDFLCQSGPQVVGVDVQALCHERTLFAEDLGSLRLQWLRVQRELESQIHEAEKMHHSCADREKRLQRLCGWIEEQKKQLNQWRQPTGQSLARKALLELETVGSKAKEVAAALQGLKASRGHVKKEEGLPYDVSFSGQVESVCQACGDLSQQMETVRAALQQTVEEWIRVDGGLKEASVHTCRVRCALQHQPLFSLQQAEGYRDFLQLLQEDAKKGEELWACMDKSYQSLEKTVHQGAAQALGDQIQEERKRWEEVVQGLKVELKKAGETLSLWETYAQLSDRCSAHRQELWRRFEELSRSSPQKDTQAVAHAAGQLQDAAEDLQSSVGDVLAASKPLTARLDPLAANLIQSETRLLSRDLLLLGQAMSGKKKSLQEDLEQQKLLHTQLEALRKQTEDIQNKLKAGLNDTNSVERVLSEVSGLFDSLVDLREMRGCVTLNNDEAERLNMLSRQWVESMTQTCDKNRVLQAERQRSQSFQEKCQNLASIQKKLEDESVPTKPQSYSSLREMLCVHQRLQAEMNIGRQLLQALLCQAVESLEKETGEKRSELMAQVAATKEGWFRSVALVRQHRSSIKEQLSQWRVYRRGSKLLWKLFRDVDPLLPPAGPAPCALYQLRSCTDDCQCVQDALDVHSSVYTQTLEAGGRLCETMTESECQSRLQSELQALQEAWERTTSLLERRRDLLCTTDQKWSQCQDGITGIKSELDQLQTELKQPLPERVQGSEDKHIQETELSLQRLAGGMRDLATMKTDLSQYVAAGDSALLEQQLEQLHGQWEELCMKVSLRRQEIADRLNAWTIFNGKNKEFCDWLTQMENKVCNSGELSIEEMVEKLKKDCMEEINLFSENKSHLKQLGEQLLLASDEAKQTQVHGSLLEVNQRWHNLFHHIEARVKKLKETLVTVQQLDKNMSNLRSWLSRMEAELSRPVTYSVCHHQEIQKRLAEQQELQRDIEQHTEGVASVLSLCDVLLRDEDAAGSTDAESDSLQETSRSLDQRWRTICAMALDRRLRIEETWRLWCKFLEDYSRFEDWLKMAERTAANPNSADVLYTVAKEELKKFESFQRQVHERLTQLELVNNQYRRLARENRTDRASQLRAMVHVGNQRWDTLHRRVAAILRRLKYFTGQREEFEGTRESMLVWLTELDLQLTNVEHFSESDVHHKIQQLNSFQKEITLNTERIDGLIVFGEGLIQKSSPQDAALIEDELEELHSYCQEVFSRLVRFHQRLSQPPMITEEPELSSTSLSLESSLELIGRPWLGRCQGSLPATPTHLLASPLERSGRETPVSVDSLPLEWDHTGDVGGSSSHEDDEEDEEDEDEEEERTYFSALSVSSRSLAVHESPRWLSHRDAETQSLQLDSEGHTEAPPALTSTPLKRGYLQLMSQCSGSIEDIKRVSLILDDEEQPEELGLTGLSASDKQSGVIERWELLQAKSRSDLHAGPQEPRELTSDLDDITSWLENVIPELACLQRTEPAASIEEMAYRAKELKEMQRMFSRYKPIMLSVNLRAQENPDLQERLAGMNRDWSRACTDLQQWDTSLRKTLMRCQEFHETLHSLLLWLAHAESRRYAVDISRPETPARALQQHRRTLMELQEELQGRQAQQASLQALWAQLRPEEEEAEESAEAQEKLHVTGSKLKLLLRQVDQDLSALQQRLDCEPASEVQDQSATADPPQEATTSRKGSQTQREKRDSPPPRSLFYRVLRAAFPLHLLLLFLLLLPCLIPLSEGEPGCTGANNFARSFYPMLRYTNGPPPT